MEHFALTARLEKTKLLMEMKRIDEEALEQVKAIEDWDPQHW